jgi:beta-aspartyl-peptidase (threonine type)
MNKYSLAIHGGAGTITRSLMTEEKETAYLRALSEALNAGEDLLNRGADALEAVTASVIAMENNPLFNAGRGSVFTFDGTHEMDAAVMRGDTLDAGAVAGVKGVRNPVELARAVMEKSEHVLLSGTGAVEFARENGLAFESDEYFYNDYRYRQWQEAQSSGKVQLDHTELKDKKFGTVGAVARDTKGNLAAATSTGGMTNKRYNRIGDSPIIGAGTYANNATCAVSCTGHGEYFIRSVVAYDISCLMEYKGCSLEEACRIVVMDKLVKTGGEGGLIAVDAMGNICMPFNSEGMYRGSVRTGSEALVKIYKD